MAQLSRWMPENWRTSLAQLHDEIAQATYKHGVLRVTMPKTARARARRMKIAIQG